jgi:hypothetical protein
MTPTTDLLAILNSAPDLDGYQDDFAPLAHAPKRAARHFYRCADCLTVAVTESQLARARDGYYGSWYGHCGACHGKLEYMGEVTRDRLIKTSLQCPCDDRCTSARGPHCDCKCGGANHGSNLLVEVTKDAGGMPSLAIDPAAKLKGDHYRALCQQFESTWKPAYQAVSLAKGRGEFLNSSEFRAYLQSSRLRSAFGEAKQLRTHRARNRAIEKLIQAMGGSVAEAGQRGLFQ